MILKVLGFLDILLAILLFLNPFVNISTSVLFLIALFLFAKGLFFIFTGGGLGADSIGNFVDIFVAGLFYISISFTVPKVLLGLFALLMIQKGVISLAY